MGKRNEPVFDRIEARFIAGLKALEATAKAGGLAAVKAKHGIPPPPAVVILGPPAVSAIDVAAARKALGVSQPIFAKILGASVQSVRAWEQGTKPPSGVARRLIGEIAHDPEYWRKRFVPKPATMA